MNNKLLNDLLDLVKKIPEYLAEELEQQNERLESCIKEQDDLRKNIDLPKFTDKEFSNKTDIGIKHDAIKKNCTTCSCNRNKDGTMKWGCNVWEICIDENFSKWDAMAENHPIYAEEEYSPQYIKKAIKELKDRVMGEDNDNTICYPRA